MYPKHTRAGAVLLLLLVLVCPFPMQGCSNQDKGTIPTAPNAPSAADAVSVWVASEKDSTMLSFSYAYDRFDFSEYSGLCAEFYHGDELIERVEMKKQDASHTVKGCFGRISVRILADHVGCGRTLLKEGEVAVTGSAYHIAFLEDAADIATFTLALSGGNDATAADTPTLFDAPVVVSLPDPTLYEREALPRGACLMPHAASQAEREQQMSHYIKELHALDPAAHITLYCSDRNAHLILTLLLSAGVEHYKVILIANGEGALQSYRTLTDGIGVEGSTPRERFERVATAWNMQKQHFADEKTSALDAVTAQIVADGAFVIASVDERVTLWCPQYFLFDQYSAEDDFLLDVLYGRTSLHNPEGYHLNLIVTDPLQMLQSMNAQQKQQFADLYRLCHHLFGACTAPLLVLGNPDLDVAALHAYLQFLQLRYPLSPIYYMDGYSGIVVEHSQRDALLSTLGVTVISAALPPELIFQSDIGLLLAGCPNIAFCNAGKNPIVALFCSMKEGKELTKTYGYFADYYLSYHGYLLIESNK